MSCRTSATGAGMLRAAPRGCSGRWLATCLVPAASLNPLRLSCQALLLHTAARPQLLSPLHSALSPSSSLLSSRASHRAIVRCSSSLPHHRRLPPSPSSSVHSTLPLSHYRVSLPSRRLRPLRSLHSSTSSTGLLHGGHHHDDELLEAEESRHRTPELEAQREKEMTRITVLGMISNIALTVVKAIAGLLGNSVAMLADAVHSISDLLTDFVTLWASKVSHKPRDQSHPYGHGKFESLGALIISGLLVATGLGIGYHAVENLQLVTAGKGLGHPTGVALVGAVISIAVKELVYQLTMKVGNKYDSKVIKANAWHHRSDAISSVVALVGVVGGMLELPVVDPIAGLLVAGLIVKAAVELAWDSLKDLTDQNVSAAVLQQVERLLDDMRGEGVVGWHQLRGRRMGPYMILDVHIEVSPKLSVTVSHQIAEKVRRHIMDQMPAVSEVLVHIDPAQRSKLRSKATLSHDHEEHQHSQASTSKTVLDTAAVAASATATSPPSVHSGHEHRQTVTDTTAPSSHSHHHAEPATLMRSQQAIERDVRVVLQSPDFAGVILALAHFTCHYVGGRLSVQLELVMAEQLRIEEAKRVAAKLDERIRAAVVDVDSVDVHIELNHSHIRESRPIQDAQVGDTQGHLHAKS